MATLTDQERQDLTSLVSLIDATSRFLAWLTADSQAVPENMRREFFVVYEIVAIRLREASAQIIAIDDTEAVTWRRLDDAGLLREPLRLKLLIWRRLANRDVPPAPTPRPGRRILGRVLKMVNSVLGSLAAVFPPLEAAKEYKDGVDVVIGHQRAKEPPKEILDLR